MQLLSAKNLWFVAGVCLLFGLLFNLLFFEQHIGINYFIYFGLLILALFIFLRTFQIAYNKKTLWYLAPILFFSIMVGVRDSKFLLFWNVVMTFGLILLFVHHLIGRNIKNCLFFDYVKTAVLLPLNMLGRAFNAMGRLLKFGNGLRESQKSNQIAKGVLITLPIAIFFLILLSSADLAFNHFVTSIFSFNINIDPTTIPRIIFVMFFTFIWLGFYSYILENVNVNEVPAVPEKDLGFKLGKIEAGILFGTLNVLFLTFVAVQIHYLFAGHSAITSLGFTYAEYAHKGFGELIVVALLTFDLIFIAEKYIEKKENGHMPWFKILSSTLIILTLIIMVSAFTRLSIYEQAYSFTLLRVLVQAFIIWLVAVFLWLGYKILFLVNNRKFIFGIFVSVITFFVLFNLFNPEAFIVRKNVEQFAQSGKLDSEYLSTLSADAAPEISKLLNISGLTNKQGQTLPFAAADILKQEYKESKNNSWQSYNFSRNNALQLTEDNWEKISNLSQVQ